VRLFREWYTYASISNYSRIIRYIQDLHSVFFMHAGCFPDQTGARMDFGSSRWCTRPSMLFFRDGLDPFLSLNRMLRNFSTPKFICKFVPTLDLFWKILF
jgi:hypothetical protein